MKPYINVPKIESQRLLTKKEILQIPGIYGCISYDHIRFVVNCNGECFTIGDGCPIYKSGNFDIKSDEKRYFPTGETLTFVKN